jgi:hypothetical protein
MTKKPQSQITGLDDASQESAAAPAASDIVEVKGDNHDDAMSGKFEMVTLHSTEGDGGSDAVFVSHNGYAYQIPRDKPSKVPAEVVQVLRDAKVTIYKNGSNGQVTEETRQRFAFSSQPI